MKMVSRIAGWIALVLGLTALFFYIIVPDKTEWIILLGSVALVNALVYVFADWGRTKRVLKTRTALYGMNNFVLITAVLGIIVFINLLSVRHKQRFDLTDSGYYTLSPQTRKVVSHLPREIKMTAFFQTDAPEKPEFQNLIDGFLELSDKIKLTFVDPDKNPAITKQYGITTYGTVALESGKQETKVKDPTEENLTNAILKVIKDEQKTVYFLEGHGERKIDGFQNQDYSTVKRFLERDGYKVEKLLLLQTGEIPKDADLLVIAGPAKPISSRELELLEAYLQRGGSVFLLVDPSSKFGMEPFLLKWGIELKNDIVIDPMSKLFGGDFAAPVVNQYILHDITREFSLATIFPVIRSVNPKPVEGVEVTELLQTGANSWAETEVNAKKVRFDEGVDRKGPIPVAAISVREVSAEESGAGEAPVTPSDKSDTASTEKKNPVRKGKLVVIGDSDFANNSYINFSGNGDLFLNTASWLAEEQDLISIRPRERKNSPISLTRAQGNTIFLLGIILFPSFVAAAGIKTWWRRRQL